MKCMKNIISIKDNHHFWRAVTRPHEFLRLECYEFSTCNTLSIMGTKELTKYEFE